MASFFFLLLNKKLEENRSAMPSGRQQHKTIVENTFKLTHKTIKRKKTLFILYHKCVVSLRIGAKAYLSKNKKTLLQT